MIHAEMMTADSGQRVLIVRGASSEDRGVPWSAVHRISDLDSITAALRRHSPNATAPEWHETAPWDLDWLREAAEAIASGFVEVVDDEGEVIEVRRGVTLTLGVTVEEMAERIGWVADDVESTEPLPIDSLRVIVIQRYVEALGCRLDVVAQHIDGVAHWLTEPCAHEGIGLPGCTTCDPSTGPRPGASRRELDELRERISNALAALCSARLVLSKGSCASSWVAQAQRALREPGSSEESTQSPDDELLQRLWEEWGANVDGLDDGATIALANDLAARLGIK